jgi:hypothetical protein
MYERLLGNHCGRSLEYFYPQRWRRKIVAVTSPIHATPVVVDCHEAADRSHQRQKAHFGSTIAPTHTLALHSGLRDLHRYHRAIDLRVHPCCDSCARMSESSKCVRSPI